MIPLPPKSSPVSRPDAHLREHHGGDPACDSPSGQQLAREHSTTRNFASAHEATAQDRAPVTAISRGDSHYPEHWSTLRLRRPLGSGGAGDVYLADSLRTGRMTALKIGRDESPFGVDRFKREFRSLRAVGDLPVARSGMLAKSNHLWGFTLQFCDGVNPVQHCRETLSPGEMPELATVLRTMLQMAHGLNAMHQTGITHGDVKPGNMIINRQGRLKFLDFGLACRDSLGERIAHPQGTAGTFQFLAPEVVMYGQHGAPADVYALGRTWFLLLSGRLPSADFSAPMVSEYEARLRQQLPPGVPAELASLMVSMLNRNPDERPTCQLLTQTLQAWLPECQMSPPESFAPHQLEQSTLDRLHRAARRAGSGRITVLRTDLPPEAIAQAVEPAIKGLFKSLPYLIMQEVDCRREQMPLRAFDAALGTLRLWAERLPEPLQRDLPLDDNPAIDLVAGNLHAANALNVVQGAYRMLMATSRNRLLVVPIRNFQYADPLSRQVWALLRMAPSGAGSSSCRAVTHASGASQKLNTNLKAPASDRLPARSASFEVTLFEVHDRERSANRGMSYSYSAEGGGTRTRIRPFEYEYHFIEYEYE